MSMKRNVASLSVAVLSTSLWAVGASAQSVTGAQGAGTGQPGTGFVGAGITFAPDYEGSEDSEAGLALFGRYNWQSGRFVQLGGSNSAGRAASLRANVISDAMSPVWEFGPVLQFRPERDAVDNDRVDRLSKVDNAVELGLFGGFATGPWSGALTWVADVSDEHDGYIITLNGAYRLPVNNQWSLTFGAAATYADSDYMDTYFSVTPSDAIRSPGLRVFDADSGVKDVGLSVAANYKINQNWGVLGSLAYFRMLDDAEDSPLVDDEGDDNQLHGVIAVTYAF